MFEITFIANCGLLIEAGGIKILVDAPYKGGVDGLSDMPKALESQIMDGASPFDHIDYMLFTHKHPDHYSEKLLNDYLTKHVIKQVILPGKDIESGVLSLSDSLRLYIYSTAHLGKEFAGVQHFCYVLESGGEAIFISADVDYVTTDFSFLNQHRISAAFVNPLMFHMLLRLPNLKNIHADKFVIYHLPSEIDDTHNMRQLIEKDVAMDKNCSMFSSSLIKIYC